MSLDSGYGYSYVVNFVSPDLLTEIVRRVAEGQRVGQAFINAGDHADEPYSYEMPDSTFGITTWRELADAIKSYEARQEMYDEEGRE